MLELKDIKKSYNMGTTKQEVLKGISLKFRKNEFTSILGKSGSGKTTLLNIIGGLDKYDSGDLIIEGTSTKNYKERDWDTYRNHRVGFIFQSYNLIMHQTVYSNVEIALTLSGVSKAERKRRVLEVIEKVGLKEHVNKKPNQLSGGQMQRVAIARALVNNPEIILADEPTGALDTNTSVQIMDLLKEIAKDKLIIMVTHNPDLAKEYSSRIITLKDGQIINDSNPFDGDEEVNERKTKATSISLLTSLQLSFNNLLTKKGRTFLTAFAGSIGIIGIALILALSNGVSNYVANIEKDSLGDLPITVERNSFDIFGSVTEAFSQAANQQQKEKDDKIHSEDDFVTAKQTTEQGVLTKNNLKEFKKYVESNEQIKNNSDAITYGYDLDLQVYTRNYERVDSNQFKLNATESLFKEMDSRESASNKYKILAGKLPENYNEVMLILPENNVIPDSVLYALDIKNKEKLKNDMEEFKKDDKYKVESSTYEYSDFLDKTYKLILNTDYYKEENGTFIDYSNDKEYLKNKINNGMDIKIVGVVQDENSSTVSIGYKHDLTLHIINEIAKTSIYKKQMDNKNINVLTGQEFDDVNDTFDNLAKQLGIYDENDPSSINMYPKNLEGKDAIVKAIEKYNEEKKNNNENNLVIKYSDMMKSLVNGVTKIVSMVSYGLIGLVAISLVVSSIMIGIITYISVLERTKEIGILRAIGASKKDIKRVFRAETIIEGLSAGILGIGITLLLTGPINLIVSKVGEIDNIAHLKIINIVLLIGLSVGLNVIAGAKPSSMAAKKDPVESLRSE